MNLTYYYKLFTVMAVATTFQVVEGQANLRIYPHAIFAGVSLTATTAMAKLVEKKAASVVARGLRNEPPPIKSYVDLQAVPGIMTLDDEGHRKLQTTCINNPVKTDTKCMGDATLVSKSINLKNANDLGCQSNDVVIATATATGIFGEVALPDTECSDAGLPSPCFSCVEGELLQVNLTVVLESSSSERRSDIGLWLDQNDEGNAKSGTCTHVVFPSGGNFPLLSPDLDTVLDTCGDIGNQEPETVEIPGTVKFECGAVGEPGLTDLVTVPYCIGWKVPGADRVCPDSFTPTSTFNSCELGTTPGTKSKCKCGSTALNILIQRCTYSASCISLTNDPVEGCDATNNNGLPVLKSPTDVFDITNTNCGGEPTFVNTDWVFTGSLCDSSAPLTGTRTYTATPPPNANQQPLVCSETVTIRDTIAPVFTDPATKTVECPGCYGTDVENCFTVPAVSDTCGATITSSPAVKAIGTGCSTKTGTYTKTYTATDACGNSDTTTATVVITDTTKPTIACPSPTGTFTCETIAAKPADPTATDLCGTATVTYKGCCFIGSILDLKHQRTWSAVDECGIPALDCTVENAVTECVVPPV